MPEPKKNYNLNVTELENVLKDKSEVTIKLLDKEKEMVLFDIKRVVHPGGQLEDNNNSLC